MNTSSPVIALISAVDAAREPAAQGFDEAFPEATIWNIVDDRLIVDALAAEGLTPELNRRMSSLIDYAIDGGADGVLLTCSMYAPVAHAVSVAVPVHAPDHSAFRSAATGGYSRIALVGSLEIPLVDAHRRFDEFRATDPFIASDHTDDLVVEGVHVPDALEPSRSGDFSAVSDVIAEAIDSLPTTPDAVLLAQYSIAPAAQKLATRLSLPVLSGPVAAAETLRSAIVEDET